MGWALTLINDITAPLGLREIVPHRLAELSAADILRLELQHGNRPIELGDLFSVESTDQADELRLIGDFSLADELGGWMTHGRLIVEGNVGHRAGCQMRGGLLRIHGSAGNDVCQGLRGGTVVVNGDVGDRAGSPLPGEKRGQQGGTLLVHGNAGNELGCRMRRGLIAVGGSCGNFPGYEMIAGTLLICGRVGIHPGLSMRRGTMLLPAATVDELPMGFHHACRLRPPMIPLLAAELARLQFPAAALPKVWELSSGDTNQLGRGEILVAG